MSTRTANTGSAAQTARAHRSPGSTAAVAEAAEWPEASGRRPWLGLGLLFGSILFTVAVLIFFGAWFADDRIEARSGVAGHEVEGDWWEDGLIAVCPIH